MFYTFEKLVLSGFVIFLCIAWVLFLCLAVKVFSTPLVKVPKTNNTITVEKN